MTLPKTLDIVGQKWSVKMSKTLLEEKGRHGETLPHTREIIIASEQALELQKSTLMHEVLHAILATSRLHGLSDSEEENVIEALEAPLLQVLRSNPTWWR